MSVTFSIQGQRVDYETGRGFINLANGNAHDLLAWLGYDSATLWGELPARELAARCRRRLWDVARNHDPALPATDEHVAGRARLINLGRAEGYLRGRCRDLLALAELAGDGFITFD